MFRLPAFEIYQPKTIAEASDALASLGHDARLYAGGTELLLTMKLVGAQYRYLVDAKTIPGLSGIERTDGWLRLGATVTHRQVEQSDLVRRHLAVLAETAARVANPRVRTMGTLGGNLCFAEPHSDLMTLLLCLEARCHLARGDQERVLSAADFVVGPYETALGPDELLVGVEVPVDPAGRRAAYGKFQIHERPMLGLAVVLDLDEDQQAIQRARLAIGCVSPTPRRAPGAEALLVGQPLAEVYERLPKVAEHLSDAAELQDDETGSAEYKRHLIGVLLRRQVERALADANASTPSAPPQ